mmetsp:Transcript_73038/g.126685  ORF Transcript_73038/g.126685 Transcript_73038/m.126685 type:complete len:210 (+) Transcript_73038:71-700(+)
MPLSVNAPEFVPGFLAATPRAANDGSGALGDQLIEKLAEAMRPQAPRSWFRVLPSDGLFCPRCVAGDASCEFHKPGSLKVYSIPQEPATSAFEVDFASRHRRSHGLPAPPTGPAPLPPTEGVKCQSTLLKDAGIADFASSLSRDKIGDEHDDASTDVGSVDTTFDVDVSDTASQHAASCTRPRKSKNKITAEPSQNHASRDAGCACHAR